MSPPGCTSKDIPGSDMLHVSLLSALPVLDWLGHCPDRDRHKAEPSRIGEPARPDGAVAYSRCPPHPDASRTAHEAGSSLNASITSARALTSLLSLRRYIRAGARQPPALGRPPMTSSRARSAGARQPTSPRSRTHRHAQGRTRGAASQAARLPRRAPHPRGSADEPMKPGAGLSVGDLVPLGEPHQRLRVAAAELRGHDAAAAAA